MLWNIYLILVNIRKVHYKTHLWPVAMMTTAMYSDLGNGWNLTEKRQKTRVKTPNWELINMVKVRLRPILEHTDLKVYLSSYKFLEQLPFIQFIKKGQIIIYLFDIHCLLMCLPHRIHNLRQTQQRNHHMYIEVLFQYMRLATDYHRLEYWMGQHSCSQPRLKEREQMHYRDDLLFKM